MILKKKKLTEILEKPGEESDRIPETIKAKLTSKAEKVKQEKHNNDI